VLAAADIAAGRLVAPLELSVPLTLAYYMVSPAARALLPQVAAFRQWLLQEAQASLREVAAVAADATVAA
jgi:LysR family glycine cleavage system transcriptional activator